MVSQLYSIKNGCLNCTMLLFQLYTIWVDKNAPYIYELIVENINCLWLLSIYDILVHKQNKYNVKNHLISASSFCVVMKKVKVSTVLSLPYCQIVAL